MSRRTLRLAAAVALGLALLAWLARGVDFHDLGASVRPAPAWTWGVAVLGLCASYAFRALRIRAELRTRHPVTFRGCLAVMLVHNAAVNVVPMRGGEAAYPILLNRRLGVPVAHAVASLVWFRVQDAIVLAVAAVALWPGLPTSVRAAGAVAVVAGTLVGLRLLARAAARSDDRPRPAVLRSARSALQALALAPRHGPAGWVFSAASWSSKLAALGLLLGALGGLAPWASLSGALGGELAGVLPLQGPAGFGTYETGVLAGAALQGHAALAIAAPAVAVHLFSLATAVVSGALAHALSRGRDAAAPAPEVHP